MILIILGVFVVLRFVGQFMIAKRNLDEEKEMLRQQREREMKAANDRKNFGKTTVNKIDKNSAENAEYTDYEEIK
ncbi:MAG: hypothetical protein IPH66_08325 [Crocinitomicaceae bacterium]|nr:hypothetical protein [Crocinitomicaceae bacterium]